MKEQLMIIKKINNLTKNDKFTFSICHFTLEITLDPAFSDKRYYLHSKFGNRRYYLHSKEMPSICGYFYDPADYIPKVISHIQISLDEMGDPLNS